MQKNVVKIPGRAPRLFLATFLVCLCAGPVLAQTATRTERVERASRRLLAVRASQPIKIDGVLDDADWSRAPIANGFIQNEPREGDPASEDTDVRVLYDSDNLYVGVFARDREPAGIIVNDLREDFAGGIANASTESDLFAMVLDTFEDKRNGYEFMVNPAGAKADAQVANEGRETNWSWDGVWTTKTRTVADGWYAEIEIPFKTLRFQNSTEQTWGLNFQRRVRRKNEDSYWAPLPRIFNLGRLSMAGTLEGLQGVVPGRDLRLKPYALSSYGDAAGKAHTSDGNGGFDVKYGVTKGLTWDFTTRTDFAQVEADEQQINLSRFSVFFPEKREFFLENSGVFGFGGAQTQASGATLGRQDTSARNDVILFYSRQIGLSSTGGEIPIVAGTRLTGRVGRYSIGALNIQQEKQNAAPATNFTAMRVRRDVFANSDIGLMLLNKDQSGSLFNRVLGLDGNFRFFQNLNINGNFTKTSAPSSVLAAGSGHDTMFSGRSTYRGRVWEFRGSYAKVGQRFDDEMGYVPRIGISKYQAFISPHLRYRRVSGWLREIWPHWEFSNVARADGALDSRYYDYHVPLTLEGGGNLELGVNRSVEGLAAPFRINARRGVTIAKGEYAFNDFFVGGRTSSAARFSVSYRYQLGDFYNGYRHIYETGFGAHVSKQLNVTANYARNVVSLPAGAFNTNLLTSRIIYSFSTKMFVNALVQYNTDARQWTSNVRFNIIHHPLSDFFFVYNEQRDSQTNEMLSRALIAKVTYMMAF